MNVRRSCKNWNGRSGSRAGSSPQTDPVKTILFSFYNGELFRIVVNYDRDETEGLTTEDMIEAISAKYGTATKPASTEIAFSSTQVYNDSELIIARWEDSQYSFNLYRSAYQPTFGMIAFSKKTGCPGPGRDRRSQPVGCANGSPAGDSASTEGRREKPRIAGKSQAREQAQLPSLAFGDGSKDQRSRALRRSRHVYPVRWVRH